MRSSTSILIFLAILLQVIISQYANAQENHMTMIDEDGQIINQEEPMMQKYLYPPVNTPRSQTRQGTQKLAYEKCQKIKNKLLHNFAHPHHPRHEQAYLQVSHSAPTRADKMTNILHKLGDFLARLKHIWKVITSIVKVVFGMIVNR